MKKTYILDTNVLLSDPTCLTAFDDNDLIIPMVVLEELDRHKSRQDEVGASSRSVSRKLDEMRGEDSSLCNGVELPSGGRLRVAAFNHEDVLQFIPEELRSFTNVDNIIIAFAKMMSDHSEHFDNGPVILVSRDINVRIKCDSLGIPCQDYKRLRVTSDRSTLYTGVVVLEDVDPDIIDQVYNVKQVTLPGHEFYPNQIVVLKAPGSKSALTRHTSGGMLLQLNSIDSAFGLKPRNKEQSFCLDLLYNPSIKLVTMAGVPGGGKTLLALAAGLDQLNSLGSHKKYEKLLITRPVQSVGKDLGYLPGTMEEKLEPWMGPIRDNLTFLTREYSRTKDGNQKAPSQHPRTPGPFGSNQYLQMMHERGELEIEAISYIRGRSIPNTYLIVDETQNLSIHELKTIITRVGEGTKVVLTGDIDQIDTPHVDVFTNGLTYAIERFKDQPIAGHITLLKGERSALATIASQIL